ncbi:MAG TPA: sugar phosphate isomerase/epimerase family protein [Planctomycetota bacterium]|nr:sugar phosphate isomerase/epimerase family protein [Planctomycetota bacterium]
MYVSTRDAMLNHTGHTDGWSALKAMNVSAVELHFGRERRTDGFKGADGQPYDLKTDAGLKAFQQKLKSENVRVCALLMGNNFGGDLNEEIRWGVDAVRAAEALGAPAVRVDMVPHTKEKIDVDAFATRCIEAAKKIILETPSSKVSLAVENHGSISNRPEFLQKIFDGVGSARMGLTLDTGNFYWYGHPIDEVYKTMERFAKYARHTHVKNIKYPESERSKQREMGWRYGDFVCPIAEGDIDHARVAKILKSVGFIGSLCLEDESIGKAPKDQQLAVLKRDIDHLKACVG